MAKLEGPEGMTQGIPITFGVHSEIYAHWVIKNGNLRITTNKFNLTSTNEDDLKHFFQENEGGDLEMNIAGHKAVQLVLCNTLISNLVLMKEKGVEPAKAIEDIFHQINEAFARIDRLQSL